MLSLLFFVLCSVLYLFWLSRQAKALRAGIIQLSKHKCELIAAAAAVEGLKRDIVRLEIKKCEFELFQQNLWDFRLDRSLLCKRFGSRTKSVP